MLMGVLLVLGGYILGSVPTGYLAGRAFGVDVRKVGSGNIGTANVLRAAGKGAAVLTLFGDMLKGLVPVVAARLLTENEWAIAAVALAAVVGHCFPVFLKFRGGKGVATGAGTSIGLAPVVGIARQQVYVSRRDLGDGPEPGCLRPLGAAVTVRPVRGGRGGAGPVEAPGERASTPQGYGAQDRGEGQEGR
jgi:hypothetical protein